MSRLLEPLKIAFDSLLGNRTRSLLTTLGVIIGVAAVITLVSMGEGAKSYILNQIRGWGVGPNTMVINPGAADSTIPELTLTFSDAAAIENEIEGLVYVVTQTIGRGRLKYGKSEYTPSFTLGISADYPKAFNHQVSQGRYYTRAEEQAGRRLVVLGKTAATRLFGRYTPIGERIKINGVGFQVIGILEEKGTMLTYDMDDLALIPVSTSQLVLGTKDIYEIDLITENEEMVPRVEKQVKELLMKRHKKEDFHIHTQQGMIDMINNILNAMTAIVSAIAAISLLVGGIGIMNIMLVAVTERTREIGIRKSIGAKTSDIFLQFVFESILITLSGALIGILIGTLAAWGIMSALRMEAVIAWGAAYIACFVALLVGTFFGVYPALRAARLDPVEALRYEV